MQEAGQESARDPQPHPRRSPVSRLPWTLGHWAMASGFIGLGHALPWPPDSTLFRQLVPGTVWEHIPIISNHRHVVICFHRPRKCVHTETRAHRHTDLGTRTHRLVPTCGSPSHTVSTPPLRTSLTDPAPTDILSSSPSPPLPHTLLSVTLHVQTPGRTVPHSHHPPGGSPAHSWGSSPATGPTPWVSVHLPCPTPSSPVLASPPCSFWGPGRVQPAGDPTPRLLRTRLSISSERSPASPTFTH